jgi:hypothetical protein
VTGERVPGGGDGTMIVFHVGILTGRAAALDERDHLEDVLRPAGVRVQFTDSGTDVWMTLDPASRTAPRPADVRRALAKVGTALDYPGGKLREPVRALIDVVAAYLEGQPEPRPDPPPEPRDGGEPSEPDARAVEYAALCARYAPDGQCTASSWGGQSHRPYGPGGYNRCTIDADPPHDQHTDDFGNVFLFNPGGKPRVRVLRHAPATAMTGGEEGER